MTQKRKLHAEKIFTETYTKLEQPLRGYVLSKIHDRMLSEDITQEAFMKTWAFMKKGGTVISMKSFLYHVAGNLIVDQYRKHKTTSLDAMLEEKDFEPSVDESEKMMNILDGRTLLHFIKDLPASYQEIMTMRYQENLSIPEIAKRIFVSNNNVSVQLHRGHDKLKKLCEQKEKRTVHTASPYPALVERRKSVFPIYFVERRMMQV